VTIADAPRKLAQSGGLRGGRDAGEILLFDYDVVVTEAMKFDEARRHIQPFVMRSYTLRSDHQLLSFHAFGVSSLKAEL